MSKDHVPTYLRICWWPRFRKNQVCLNNVGSNNSRNRYVCMILTTVPETT